MERLTRLVVILSLLAALTLQVVLTARAFPPIAPASLLAFLLALALSIAFPRLGPALVLGLTYIAPAIILALAGNANVSFQCVWLAALSGPVAATVIWPTWRLPPRWKWPVIVWLLCIAFVWPVIVLRECDFNLHLLNVYHLANSGLGIPPPVEATAITHTVLTLGLPLLWLDRLFGIFGTEPPAGFLPWVMAPLAASWFVSSLLAMYQAFVNMDFLNGGLYSYLGRASGGMLDADAFGVVAAIWGPVLLAWTVGTGRRWLLGLGAVAMVTSWMDVWASASRTATAAACVGLMFVLWYAVKTLSSRRARGWLLAGIAAALAMTLTVVAIAPQADVGAFARIRKTLPSTSLASLKHFAVEMWNRNDYGAAATRMIREFPLVGVGIGTFPTLAVDYGSLSSGTWLTPDNAQNWYRHQLAEMGVVGSLGWIVWLAMLIPFVVRSRGSGATHLMTGALKGTLIGVALVSLVGMPTENTAAALTVLVFLFWLFTAVDPAFALAHAGGETVAAAQPRRARWVAAWLIVALFVSSTAYVGWSDLRPPYRALRFNWEYVVGLYGLERGSGGGLFRWTTQEAVDVFPASNRYLKLRFWIHHPDAAKHPIEVKIWRKDPSREQLIVDTRLNSGTPVTAYVRVPKDHGRMMLETWVSRTWKPSSYGQKDTRTLGLAIDDWTFVDKPPPGATVIN